MTHAYINYPNPHITLHGQATCADIGKMHKTGQRRVRITANSISHELQQFARKSYRFGADASNNDMWLEVDFADAAFEQALVAHVQHLIGASYKPLASVPIEEHCS